VGSLETFGVISVDQAIEFILDGTKVLECEAVPIAQITGRISGRDIMARHTQPPFAASAMDGYAAQFASAGKGAELFVIGEAPAGAPFDRSVGAGEAVRIFTGGMIPEGADHIIIQEDVEHQGNLIKVIDDQNEPKHIRAAGIDFKKGDCLVQAGARFSPLHGSILASANIAKVESVRRPRVALFSNGNELREPGSDLKPGEVVNANHFALSAMIEAWGGEAIYLGCAPDDQMAIAAMFERGRGADIVVPVGGASVGDYDFVKSAFDEAGGTLVFSKVAVKPGKPTWFGRLGSASVIGFPGNPASAIVTAGLFLKPLISRLLGASPSHTFETATLAYALPANGHREAFLRATRVRGMEGPRVEIFPNQDSSLISPFGICDVLIRRRVGAGPLEGGSKVDIVSLLE